MIGRAQPPAGKKITFDWQTTARLFSQPVSNFSKFLRDSFVPYIIYCIPGYPHHL
jgi:hypothetical protein